MSNYSDDPAMVRVDFFKPGGKWYCTEAVKWTGGYVEAIPIHTAFALSLRDHLGGPRLSEMTAVCLEPYHANTHPVMIKDGGWQC